MAEAETDGGHSFSDAPLFCEVFLEPFYQSPEDDVGLVDERDRQIGDGLVSAFADDRHIVGTAVVVGAVVLRRLGAVVVEGPLFESSYSEVVLVVHQQFVEACLCDVHQFQLGLRGGGRCGRAFSDVLLPRSCSLHHLVDCSIALGEVLMGEVEGDVINALRLLVGYKVFVVSSLREEWLRFLHDVTNRTNETNRANETNEPNETNEANKANGAYKLFLQAGVDVAGDILPWGEGG